MWKPIGEFPWYEINEEGNVRRIRDGFMITTFPFNGVTMIALYKQGVRITRQLEKLRHIAYPYAHQQPGYYRGRKK